MRSATVSGEPKATVSRTRSSQSTCANFSAMARKPGCSSGCTRSIRSGIRNFRSASWYHISASRVWARASASVGAT